MAARPVRVREEPEVRVVQKSRSYLTTALAAVITVAAVVFIPILLSEDEKETRGTEVDVGALLEETAGRAVRVEPSPEVPVPDTDPITRMVEGGRAAEALELLKKELAAAESTESRVMLNLKIASVYGNQAAVLGSPEQAANCIAYLETALKLDPANLDALRGMAMARYRTGDYTGGIELLQKAIKLAPTRAELWYTLGDAYRFAGRGADAETAWKKSLELDADYEPARKALGKKP